MGKSLNSKYGQKLLDRAKKSTSDAIEIPSKRVIQKTAEATSDLIGNKIADKIASVLKKSNNNNKKKKKKKNNDVELTAHKKDKYLQKKENKLLIN